LFNALLLRLERIGRLRKIAGRRIGTEFMTEAECKASGNPGEQDNDRQGPQYSFENSAFRHRCAIPILGLYGRKMTLDMWVTSAAKHDNPATLAANSLNPYFTPPKLSRGLEFADFGLTIE